MDELVGDARQSGAAGAPALGTLPGGAKSLFEVTFLSALTASGQVRMQMRLRLTEWGLARVADTVESVAGELIANAVQASPAGQIAVRMVREGAAVSLGVWDGSDQMPVAAPVAELELADVEPDRQALDAGHDTGTGGWGLPSVEALSVNCGADRTRPHGKRVWAVIAI